MRNLFRNAAAVVVATLVTVPLFAARGSADFTHFVALGDSLTFGVSNNAGVITHQQFSWPAIVARQVGLRTDCTAANDAPNCFQQALISEPGILPELYLASLQPFALGLKPGLGSPINTTLARPYNNLAIDGAELADAFSVDGDGNEAFSAPIVLRGQGTVIQQALVQHPTFIGVWYGADDFFGTLQKGTPAGLTPVDQFTTEYNQLLDTLIAGAPNAGMVVGNLPSDIRLLPFVNLIPPFLANPTGGAPIPLIADLGGGNYGPLPPGSAILFTSSALLRTGYGIPAALAPLLPNLPDVGKPLPDAAVLTPSEIETFNSTVAAYNAAIAAAAASHNVPMADLNAFFQRAKTGIQLGPVAVSLAYPLGGLVSLDSAHPSDMGYLLIANEFIKTINSAYGTEIPVAGISQLFANNYALPSNGQFLPIGMPFAEHFIPVVSYDGADVAPPQN